MTPQQKSCTKTLLNQSALFYTYFTCSHISKQIYRPFFVVVWPKHISVFLCFKFGKNTSQNFVVFGLNTLPTFCGCLTKIHRWLSVLVSLARHTCSVSLAKQTKKCSGIVWPKQTSDFVWSNAPQTFAVVWHKHAADVLLCGQSTESALHCWPKRTIDCLLNSDQNKPPTFSCFTQTHHRLSVVLWPKQTNNFLATKNYMQFILHPLERQCNRLYTNSEMKFHLHQGIKIPLLTSIVHFKFLQLLSPTKYFDGHSHCVPKEPAVSKYFCPRRAAFLHEAEEIKMKT